MGRDNKKKRKEKEKKTQSFISLLKYLKYITPRHEIYQLYDRSQGTNINLNQE